MEVQLPPHESTFCGTLWVPENSKQERGEGRVWWGGEGGYHLLGSHLGEGDTQKGRKGGGGAVCVQTRACVARAQKAGGGRGGSAGVLLSRDMALWAERWEDVQLEA